MQIHSIDTFISRNERPNVQVCDAGDFICMSISNGLQPAIGIFFETKSDLDAFVSSINNGISHWRGKNGGDQEPIPR